MTEDSGKSGADTIGAKIIEQFAAQIESNRTQIKDAVSVAMSEASSKLRDYVDERVEKQFSRDREFIKETIGAGLKVLGAAVGLIAIVITLFGIKTLGDIHGTITAAAKNAFEARLTNPSSAESQSLERILNRTVLDSYSLRLVRQRTQRDRYRRNTEVVLEENDGMRLVKMFKSPNVDLAQFQDIANVLVEASGESQWGKISPVIVDAVLAKGTEFEWLKTQPNQRAYLIDLLAKKQTEPFVGVHEIIIDKTIAKAPRIAAMRYVARLNATTFVSDLEAISGEEEREVQKAAIEALSSIKPDSKRVKNWIESAVSSPLDLETIHSLMSVAKNIMNGGTRSFVGNAPDLNVRKEMSLRIWRAIAQRGEAVVTKYASHFASDEDKGLQLRLSKRENNSMGWIVPSSTVFGRMEEVLATLTAETADIADLGEFRNMLQTLGVTQNLETSIVSVGARLKNSASIVLESGSPLSANEAPGGVSFSVDQEVQPKILVKWIDSVGNNRIGVIKKINGAKDMLFSIRPLERIIPAAEEE